MLQSFVIVSIEPGKAGIGLLFTQVATIAIELQHV